MIIKPNYIPQCITGKGGRYFVVCVDIKNFYNKIARWNIGWRLNKEQAMACADACQDLPALVYRHADDYYQPVYRNIKAKQVYEARKEEGC